MNFYGAVIPVFFKRVFKNLSPEVYLPGSQTRDFMFIEDAIRAYEIAETSNIFGKPINFGTGKEISILDLAKMIIKIEGKKIVPCFIEGRPNEVMRLKADIGEAKKMGFIPRNTIEQGLVKYSKWLKNNLK